MVDAAPRRRRALRFAKPSLRSRWSPSFSTAILLALPASSLVSSFSSPFFLPRRRSLCRPAAPFVAIAMKRMRSGDAMAAATVNENDDDGGGGGNDDAAASGGGVFAEVPVASQASSLTDAVALAVPKTPRTKDAGSEEHADNAAAAAQRNRCRPVLMPWMGFGTYRMGKDRVEGAVMEALRCGYRCVDTAFAYGGGTTELRVGTAIQSALQQQILRDRSELFVISKHWRSYHGYKPALECLEISLSRLGLDYLDLWLMHWPGPAWEKRPRGGSTEPTMPTPQDWQGRDDDDDHRWRGASHTPKDMSRARAETWRAMEDAYRRGKVRAIGVSNFSVRHLQALKETATLWPPAVNQIELHPLRPQTELVEYCRNEGVVIQAYASLGGQDTGKAAWKNLLGGTSFVKEHRTGQGPSVSLLHSKPVAELAQSLRATPAQVLLRWGLEQGCALVPKAARREHLEENAQVLTSPHARRLSCEQARRLQDDLLELAVSEHPDPIERENLTRLCWRSDPLRLLDFE